MSEPIVKKINRTLLHYNTCKFVKLTHAEFLPKECG